jgi:CRP-like cAMP-binding protein
MSQLANSKPAALQSFLDRLTARSRLAAEERQAILGLPGETAEIRTNRDFVRLGEKVAHASLVAEGLVGRFGQNREGNRQITAIHVVGDMANLHSVVFPNASSALQALSASTIVRIPHEALRRAAARFPALAEAFWRDGSVDSAILSEWVVNVGRRNARSRTAHLLCEMATRYTQIGQALNPSFRFEATQTHLADALGLTSIHVNRTLQALRQDSLITLKDRVVTILDWEELAKIGDFNPDYLQTRGPFSLREQCDGA